ncbi:hypothetical protein CWC13_19075, partial [Pseudoalteromonas ruthenica]
MMDIARIGMITVITKLKISFLRILMGHHLVFYSNNSVVVNGACCSDVMSIYDINSKILLQTLHGRTRGEAEG